MTARSLGAAWGLVALRVAGIVARLGTLTVADADVLFILDIIKDALATTSQVLGMLAACGDDALDLRDDGVVCSLGLQAAKEVLGGVTQEADIAKLVGGFV